MFFGDKFIDSKVIRGELLVELFSAEILFPLKLEKTDNSHHQKEDAKEIQEYPFV
jgi:hypothetical protein